MSNKFIRKDVVTVCLTGAAGQIGYALLPMIARGDMLGPRQKVALRLLDTAPMLPKLHGVKMELIDCAFPLLSATAAPTPLAMTAAAAGATSAGSDCSSTIAADGMDDPIVITSDPFVAFEGCDIAILCGASPRTPGMERKDLLGINTRIFAEQGRAMGLVGSPHCRVLVVGNPANTNALTFATSAHKASLSSAEGVLDGMQRHRYRPLFDKRNVSALMRLDHNRTVAQCALKWSEARTLRSTGGGRGDCVDTCCSPANIRNAIVWGNHSSTQVPDVSNAVGIVNTTTASSPSSSPSVLKEAIPIRELVDGINTTGSEVGAAVKRSRSSVAAEGKKKDDTDAVPPPSSPPPSAFFDSEPFFTTVQQRGLAIIQTRGQGSAASASKAIVDHMRDWIIGGGGNDGNSGGGSTAEGCTDTTTASRCGGGDDCRGADENVLSMAVLSDGNPYGVPPNLFFSFPCVCEGDGEWRIATETVIPAAAAAPPEGRRRLPIVMSPLIRDMIAKTTAELMEERAIVEGMW